MKYLLLLLIITSCIYHIDNDNNMDNSNEISVNKVVIKIPNIINFGNHIPFAITPLETSAENEFISLSNKREVPLINGIGSDLIEFNLLDSISEINITVKKEIDIVIDSEYWPKDLNEINGKLVNIKNDILIEKSIIIKTI